MKLFCVWIYLINCLKIKTSFEVVQISYIVWTIVIAVRIGYDTQTGEVIAISENRTRFHAISGVPDRETISEEILGGSAYPELNL